MKPRGMPLEMKTTRSRKSEEEALQCSVVEHLRWRAPRDVLWWHCPNGGPRSKSSAGRLKAMGVRPGVPDLQFLFPDGRTAFMELKVKGGVISDAQAIFGAYCDSHGIEYVTVWSIDEALKILTVWGVLQPEVAL